MSEYDTVNAMPCTTREEAIAKLMAAEEITEWESPHRLADRVLGELLTALGYGDVVETYDKLDISWHYA